jgi:lipopolysaccharide transport system permease protein
MATSRERLNSCANRGSGRSALEDEFLISSRIKGPVSALLTHWSLTSELAKREVLGRYRGASFGLFWSLLTPFFLLCVYTFAFGSVLGSHWPQIESGRTHFSIILFTGLIVHGFFAECFSRAPGLVVSNPNFVKKVIFPLEILPWPMVLSALFHLLMNVIVFMVLHYAIDRQFAWTIVLFPIVMLPLVVLTLGISWILASLGVYLRDISQVTGVISMAMLFLSSAMMPLASVPQSYRWVFELNPLTFIIDQAREVMLWGRMPDWLGLGLYLVVAIAVMYGGRAWFMVSKQGFADVL